MFRHLRPSFLSALLALTVCAESLRAQTAFWQLLPNVPPNAGLVQSLFFDQRGDLYAATSNGVLRSTNGGASWIDAGSGLPQGSLINEFASPAQDVVLAAVADLQFNSGGVYRTTNAGNVWAPTGLANSPIEYVASLNSQIIFAAHPYRPLFRSTNGGTVWGSVFSTGGVNAIVVNRLGNSTFIATGDSAVRRSTDNGTTWLSVNGNLSDSLAINALAADSGGIVYAGVSFPSNYPGRVYRSTDNGGRWAIAGALPTFMLQILGDSTAQVFALPVEHGVYRSTNAGASWISLNTNLPESSSVSRGTISFGRFIYIGTYTGLMYRSIQPVSVPKAPFLLSPANGATGVPQQVTLLWTRFESGLRHHVQLSTSSAFSSLVLNDSTLTTNTVVVDSLAGNQTYYWRVRVGNMRGWGNYSRVDSFRTATPPPPAPTLNAPPDSATNQPTTLTLSWFSLGPQVTYHLQVATNLSFTNLLVNDSTITGTQRQVGPLAHNTTYFWRVRASNSPGGAGPFSPARRFTTTGLPVVQRLPSSLSYRLVQLGSRVNGVVRLVNLGTASLVVDSIRLTGPNANDFVVIGSTGPFPPVVPFDTLRIVAQCAPQTLGIKSAFLRIFSNAPSSPDTISLSADVIPSQVQVNVAPARLGDSLRLRVTVQQGFRPVLSQLFFRNGGKQTYQTTGLTPRGDTLVGTIPPQVLNIRGVEYYVLLFDSANNVLSFPAGDYINNPALVRVSVQSVLYPQALQGLRYRMISIPLDVAQRDFLSVLGDDWGSYDRVKWRIFRWNVNAYAEFQQVPEPFFRPGVAFWLITRSGGSFDVENALSVISTQPYTILLQPGWNQIATPFAFPVAWQAIGNSELVRAPFFFDGVQFIPNASTLQPWEGYFVFNDSSSVIPLVVLPVEAGDIEKSVASVPVRGSYTIQLSASSGALSDAYNYLGFRHDATEEDDKLDLPEPPPVGDYVQVSIVENERLYACNFRPLTHEGQQWIVRLASTLPHQTVRVSVHEEGVRPPGFRVFVLDEDERAAVPINDDSFIIRLRDANEARTLRIIVGTEAFAERTRNGIPLEPIEYALYQNSPNPFNPSTTIRYALKHRSDVRVEVFNLLGQSVRTLVRAELGAGVYSVVWDGTNNANMPVGSGVYIVQLHADEFRASKKLMLVR